MQMTHFNGRSPENLVLDRYQWEGPGPTGPPLCGAPLSMSAGTDHKRVREDNLCVFGLQMAKDSSE